MISNTT